MKVYIIIPAYNEEKRISGTLKAYCEYFTNIYNLSHKTFLPQIIVALNNTTDNTEKIVRRYEADYPLILSHLNLPGKGKGYAIIEGWKEALKEAEDEDFIGFVDADNATIPEAFMDLILKLNEYRCFDGAIASRYIPGAIVNPKQTWKRVFVSRVFNKMIRALLWLPYKDTQCGAKIFRKKSIEAVWNDLGLTRWAFDVDLLFQMKRKGFKVREFPTLWSDKAYSKINFMTAGPRMALAIIRLRLLYSPFKFIVRAYDIIMKKVRACKKRK